MKKTTRKENQKGSIALPYIGEAEGTLRSVRVSPFKAEESEKVIGVVMLFSPVFPEQLFGLS